MTQNPVRLRTAPLVVTVVAVVAANAAVQALFVALAPRSALDAGAIGLAILSGIALVATSVTLWSLVRGGHSPRRTALIAASAVVVAALAVIAPVLLPLGIAVACPVIATGGIRAAARTARAHPWRLLGLVVLTALAVVLGTVLAMLLGLLVTGAPAAALTWVCVGLGAAALTAAWARLADQP
ncbi:MAG: hypothetical protein J0I43_07355 [Microbacterium sp.]|uniref:hypothetical protein n=1 Tax=Microbacterium sp. TaxID=51671 RepID=UPI001AC1A635|nr:hypothetical protein [Microbacterium sp.]MBN9177167.1 hypothetical protein [Microbacterium sp.]